MVFLARKARPLHATLLLAVLLVAVGPLVNAQNSVERVTVIRASRVITGTGEILTPGEVVIDEGKITLVGNQLEVPDDAVVIDATGQTLMAGMILARTRHGLNNLSRNGTYCDWTPMTQLVEDEIIHHRVALEATPKPEELKMRLKGIS